jgi:hypothetical protein
MTEVEGADAAAVEPEGDAIFLEGPQDRKAGIKIMIMSHREMEKRRR